MKYFLSVMSIVGVLVSFSAFADFESALRQIEINRKAQAEARWAANAPQYNREFLSRLKKFASYHRGMLGGSTFGTDSAGAYYSAQFATGDGFECSADRSYVKCANSSTNQAFYTSYWR